VNVTGVFTQETAKNGVPGPSAVKSPTKQSMHEPDTAKEVSVDRQKEKRIVPDNLFTSEPIPSTLSAVDRVSEVASKQDREHKSSIANSSEKRTVRSADFVPDTETSSNRSNIVPIRTKNVPAGQKEQLQSGIIDVVKLKNNADEKKSSPTRQNTRSTDSSPETGWKFPAELRVRIQNSLTNAMVAQDGAKKDEVGGSPTRQSTRLISVREPNAAVETRYSERIRSSSSSSPVKGNKTAATVPSNLKPDDSKLGLSTSKEPWLSPSKELRPYAAKETKSSTSKEPVPSRSKDLVPSSASKIPRLSVSKEPHLSTGPSVSGGSKPTASKKPLTFTSKEPAPSASKISRPSVPKKPQPSTSKEPHASTSQEPVPSTSKAANENVLEQHLAAISGGESSSDSDDSLIDNQDDHSYGEPKKKRSKKARAPRKVWTNVEEELVYQGVKACGVGKWAQIHLKYLPGRSNVDIKDKYRTMLRQGRFKELGQRFGPL